MSNPAEITAKVLEAQKSFGGPAITVSNAGIPHVAPPALVLDAGGAHSIDVGWTTR